jgi:hypothetical protein
MNTVQQQIQAELLSISTAAGAWPKTLPYLLPKGYGPQVAQEVLQKIKAEETAALPANYFEGFADKLMTKIKAEETINELPSFGKIKPAPFAVPQNYFNTMPAVLAAAINAEEPQVLQQSKIPSPYQVPTGYFENFTVKTNERQTAKLVSIKRWKWVAAAAAIIVAAFTTINIWNSQQKVPNEIVQQPTQVKPLPETQQNPAVSPQKPAVNNNITPEEILELIETPVVNNKDVAYQEATDDEIDAFLEGDLTEEELINF